MAGQALTKLFKPRVQSFGKVGSQIAEGVGGALTDIGKSKGHRILGGKYSVPSDILHNQAISRGNSARVSSTSRSNQVFVGNRHPQLSPGVEDFTGLDIPEGAVEWMTTGKANFLQDKFLKAKGSTKANPKYYTFDELVAQWEAAPKGSLKNTLKKKIDGYKSGMATPWAKDAEDIIRYQVQNEPAITASLKETNPELFSPQVDQSAEFHHLSMKEIDGDFFAHAEQLVRDGKATVIDLINLHNLNKKYGIESGSRNGAALWMQRGPHNWMHKGRTLPAGIEPSSYKEAIELRSLAKPPDGFKIPVDDWKKMKEAGIRSRSDVEEIHNWAQTIGYKKAIKKWKARKAAGRTYVSDGKSEIQRMLTEIKSIDNIAELTAWRKDYIENVVLPMREEAVLVESFAKEMNPIDLHKANKWQQNQMRDQLEELRLNKKRQNYKESLEGEGPIAPNPEYEELLPHQLK